jgi:hypothetical protein
MNMANTRFDICSPRKGKDDKTFWTRIGTAWQSDKGIQLVFDALPLPDAEGRCVANLFEPKERDAAPRQQQRAPASDDLGSDIIPF